MRLTTHRFYVSLKDTIDKMVSFYVSDIVRLETSLSNLANLGTRVTKFVS